MQVFCELCGRDGLTLAYAPDHSRLGISVHVCCYCGLVQSLPRIDHDPNVQASDDLRLGKTTRAANALAALKRHVPSDHFHLIDIGSDRGVFVSALTEEFPAADIVAVEPDVDTAKAAADKASLFVARIESLKFDAEAFDVIHSCHTIEHLAHPLRVLKDHARILKSGGLLLLDAPNIAGTGADDILEEWFVDKHLYHFSARTLTRMVERAGFEIIEAPDPADRENLFLVAKKTGRIGSIDPDPAEVDHAVEVMSNYAAARAHNVTALRTLVDDLSAMVPRGLAVWGAGRLFDTLVTHGGFDAKCLAGLIDTHLAFIGERHCVRLSAPEALEKIKPGVVVVLTRAGRDNIIAEAKHLAPDAEIISFTDLLGRARLKLAA